MDLAPHTFWNNEKAGQGRRNKSGSRSPVRQKKNVNEICRFKNLTQSNFNFHIWTHTQIIMDTHPSIHFPVFISRFRFFLVFFLASKKCHIHIYTTPNTCIEFFVLQFIFSYIITADNIFHFTSVNTFIIFRPQLKSHYSPPQDYISTRRILGRQKIYFTYITANISIKRFCAHI